MQTLADLRESFRVYALCVPCGRMEPVDLEAAMRRLGGGAPVTALRERVRCRGCGVRTHDIRIVYVGPHGRRVVFHYRRDPAPG